MAQALDLTLPYKVADISLADFGRKEMQLSEQLLPFFFALSLSCQTKLIKIQFGEQFFFLCRLLLFECRTCILKCLQKDFPAHAFYA